MDLVVLVVLAMIPSGASYTKKWGVPGTQFINFASRPMVLFFKGETPVHSGVIAPNGGVGGFHTYIGHEFFWGEDDGEEVTTTYPGAVGKEVFVTDSVRVYYYYDDSTTKEDRQHLEDYLQFSAEYRVRTGRHWVGTTWPRPPPTHKYWPVKEIGQVFQVNLDSDDLAGQWTCSQDEMADCLEGKRKPGVNSKQTVLEKLTVEVLSLEPIILRVLNFISDFEADYLISQALPLLHKSTVGDGDNVKIDETRTSRSAWLSRTHSSVTDSIYQRMAHVTQMPIDEMHDSHVESMNVLNYPVNAEYLPHYDWGADGNIESRFISGLMYLNTVEKGGGTGFPIARLPNGTEGVEVAAVKGSLVFFYDLLPDGNADAYSLHAGLPVEAGEKWVAPMWIWDPQRYRGATQPQFDEQLQQPQASRIVRRYINPNPESV